MTLNSILKDLEKHKKQMAHKYNRQRGIDFDTMYSQAWTSKVMQGYTEVEMELQRILKESEK